MGMYINLEEGLGRIRGNKSLYKRMLDMFLKSAEFDEFEKALASGDNARAGDVAHAIKGMVGNLGMPPLFEASSKLMDQFRSGEADPALLDEYRKALDETRKEVETVMPELG